jgi:hypothetical protein
MVAFAAVMVPLSKALGLSLVAERAIEFGKNLLEPLRANRDTRAQPDMDQARQAVADVETLAQRDAAARAVEQVAESKVADRTAQSGQLQAARTQLLSETDPAKRAALLKQASQLKQSLTADEQHGEWDERVPTSVLLVEDATDPDDGWSLRSFVLQLVGFAVGIILASFTDLRLFSAFLPGGESIPGWTDHVFTGLFIGGGSGPVHTLIDFISARKSTVEAAELAVAETPQDKAPRVARPGAPAIITSGAEATADVWVDIPYAGGVDLSVLESVHRRDANPDLVVYHHTAMSSESTFDDVVRVIKSRTDANGNHWLTGYNCVILADGSIHAFCRWDRYGSHAVGYNRRSLGISFNGNFETNPNVPFSNPDGRYGAPRPTEPQLRAGARVVALWTFLYSIKVDFTTAIIPHNQIASKACPGSNFPYEDFKKLVTYYRQKWEYSTPAQERIAAFKLKSYLYI